MEAEDEREYWVDGGPSWAYVFRAIEAAAERSARRFGLTAGDTAELHEFLIVRVCREVSEFEVDRESGAPFAAWLGMMLKFRALDFCRRIRPAGTGATVSLRADEQVVAAPSAAPIPLSVVLAQEEVEHLRACLAALTPSRRERIMQVDGEGRAIKSLAAELGIRRDTLSKDLAAARSQLRQCMKQRGFGEDPPREPPPTRETDGR